VPGPTRPSLARLAGTLSYQQVMLGDARRNRAFARALRARVTPGATVLDLGAGTGVWAVMAARLGARRVVAVEREAVLVPVIEALAREAGVEDRLEVVRADARRVRLRREFDVVVGELVGNEAFEEGLVPVFERARRHFLRPGGALVPEWVSLVAAPVVAPVRLGLSPPFLPSASVAALTGQVPRNLHPGEIRPLAPGRELLRLDLHTARAANPLPTARVSFRVREGRAVGGLAVWVTMGLAPGVSLSTRAGTHWLPTLLPVEPQPAGPGRLEVEIDWNPARRRWSTRFTGARGRFHAAHYSPLFAWGSVRAALRRRH
jgi:type III protein arginine methyltransferase